jgi:pyruvate/oxaloacetate carboxyltransferase/biotin carboxyl carrier protein
MTEINFVDQTLRDAQQSLWGYMMTTDHMTPVAEAMDRIGYKAIATVGSQAFTVQVRNLNENPWERIRTLTRLITKTNVRGSYQIGSLSSFDLSTPRDIIILWIKRSIANGIKSFWVCDFQHEMEKFNYFARIAKAEGAEVVPSMIYTSSPAHTSEYWERQTQLLMEAKDYIDRIHIEDASGIITPEATRKFVKTVRKNCSGIPLEFHSHCNTGLAPLCYLEAIQEGVETLHTTVSPLANGTSLPSIENVLKNAQRLGFTANIDEEALETVSSHFRTIAENEGFPMGIPMEYDLFQFEHQLPGGMMTNFTRQLREVGMEDRLQEFMEEMILVRKEFGYPVMGTPYSQIIGAQSIENVVTGKRYGQITDEVIKYVLGYYGEPVVPIDQEVMDMIMRLPRTKQFQNWTPEGYDESIEELRQKNGPDLSDDDLLLKILIPGWPVKSTKPKKTPSHPAGKSCQALDLSAEFPSRFSVDVDGDVFNVKISPVQGIVSAEDAVEVEGAENILGVKEIPPGAFLSGMPGLILSIDVKVGDHINEGDQVAIIEAMKMRRLVNAPHSGEVKEICAKEGEMVESKDILMVVQ